MNFYGKKIIKFFLIVFLFNLNTNCFSNTLSELLSVDNYEQVRGLFNLPANELIEKFNFILQSSIELEKRKLSDTDSWYVNSITTDPTISYDDSATSDEDSVTLSISVYSGSEADAEESLYSEVVDQSYIEKYDLNSPDEKFIIIGDLHGNFDALNSIIRDLITRDILTEDLKISEGYTIICLGDYIDRGNRSLETISVLMLLRLLNPDNFIILAGNHENIIIFSQYGFADELVDKFGMFDPGLIDKISAYFELLPSAYFVSKPSGKLIQFSHAGWSYLYNERDFLYSDKRFFRISDSKSIELLWNDIKLPGKHVGYRGAGRTFAISEVIKAMKASNIIMKFGGHQHFLPKNEIKNSDFSRGFIRLSQEPSIFVLISGSINYGRQDINYYPSYLELVREEVTGYFQREYCWAFEQVNPNEMPFILN